MAHTAHKNAEMMEELQEAPEVIDAKAKQVAEAMQTAFTKSQKTVFFTGAGISTAAGISDYRGPEGVWTCAAQKRQSKNRSVNMASAVPTKTHMAIAHLVQKQQAYVISQNVDGMHRKSGVPAADITELHGNSNIEECNRCGKRYMRDYMIHGQQNHYTGRMCSARGCGGALRDTIINFGENLSAKAINDGFLQSEKAGVHICLGSSLTVRPACDMPVSTKDQGGLLVIVNLQRTPLDKKADVRVHCKVDEFMERLMHHLSVPTIPHFVLKRRVVMWRPRNGNATTTELCIAGVDDEGTPQSLFDSAIVDTFHPTKEQRDTKDPMQVQCPPHSDEPSRTVTVKAQFFGHYHEEDVALRFPDPTNPEGVMAYDVAWDLNPDGEGWVVTAVESEDPASLIPSYEKGTNGSSRVDGVSAPVKDGTGIDYSGWFAVTPLDTCPHCDDVKFVDGVTLDTKAACEECGNVGENMQCLTCWKVFCGRHVNKHMLDHNAATGHPIVVGFADLSFWCYECEAYINPSNPRLSLIYRLLHNAKFETNPDAQ